MKRDANSPERKWTVPEICRDWGDCHPRTVYRTLKRKNAEVIHLAGRLLVTDTVKRRIEDDSTRQA